LRIAVRSIIMAILLIFQTTLIPIFQIRGIKPDLPLVYAFCLSLTKGENIGASMGFCVGILEDIMYGRLLGFSALAKFISCYILGYSSRNIFKGPAVITIGLVFLGSLFYNLIFVTIGFMLGDLTHPLLFFLPVALPSALYNMIISPFIYSWVVKMEDFLDYYFNIKY
jgi:rod shape-determining protein MreD